MSGILAQGARFHLLGMPRNYALTLFSVARVLRSFSPLSSSITRSDLNLALKFLLCLDMIMDPFFHTGLSISDSLKTVRKSVLIYETIIVNGFLSFTKGV